MAALHFDKHAMRVLFLNFLYLHLNHRLGLVSRDHTPQQRDFIRGLIKNSWPQYETAGPVR